MLQSLMVYICKAIDTKMKRSDTEIKKKKVEKV